MGDAVSGMLKRKIFPNPNKNECLNAMKGDFKLYKSCSFQSTLVTTPLNGVEVDTLLHKLPQRTELTQEGNTFLHCLENVVNLGVGGEATDAEADTAVGALVTAAESTENVRGFKGGGCTGGTGGKSDILEGHEERLTLDICEGDVDATGVMELGRTVESGVLHGEETVTQLLGKS